MDNITETAAMMKITLLAFIMLTTGVFGRAIPNPEKGIVRLLRLSFVANFSTIDADSAVVYPATVDLSWVDSKEDAN